ncbi:hypothetical protein SH528x_004766 [Novipirellula sp. SH528]|uniref:hypothetical protein n=1 Tax=Novipirellula sp. SH528 TaxID=3454466 RepID=UPI003FA14A12
MMNATLMNVNRDMIRGLYWKETRQLLPLVFILVAVGVFLMMIWGISQDARNPMADYARSLPLVLPALFAAGAGALVVGQEKEQRTLWWLISMPVVPKQLIGIKFAVGLIGLAVMWVICWILFWIVQYSDGGPSRSLLPYLTFPGVADYIFLHLHSVFLLACGFYTAWRLKSTFASLIAILPLACIPFVLQSLGYAFRREWAGQRLIDPQSANVVSIGTTSVAILIMTWMAYRAAQRTLAPRDPILVESFSKTISRVTSSPKAKANAARTPYRFVFSSLVWQSVYHNRITLLAIVLLMIAGTVAGVFSMTRATQSSPDFTFLVLVAAAGFVGVSWLGVFAFTGDGSATRLRFLADRGVSPTVAWLGRHSIGVWIVSVILLLHTALLYGVVIRWKEDVGPLPSTAMVALLVFVIYGVSQWISQLTRLLAVSAVLSPIVSIAAAYWLGYCAVLYNAPLWLILLCGTFPYLASWLQMRRFMDEIRGPFVWTISVLAVVLFVWIPMIPMQIEIARFPRMSPERRANLLAQAKAVDNVYGYVSPIVLAPQPGDRNQSYSTEQDRSPLEFFEQRSFSPSDAILIAEVPPGHDGAASMDQHTLTLILSLATYAKLEFDSSEKSPEAIDMIGDWFRVFTTIVERLRNSERVQDQDFADRVEIWLSDAIKSDAIESLHERDFVRHAKRLLADRTGRYESRRRAVLKSWAKPKSAIDGLGGYSLSFWAEDMSSVKRAAVAKFFVDAVADAALRMLEAGEAGESTEPMRRELHGLLIGQNVQFEDGPYSDRIRNHPIDNQFFPASQWYAAWEEEVE